MDINQFTPWYQYMRTTPHTSTYIVAIVPEQDGTHPAHDVDAITETTRNGFVAKS